MAEFLAGLTPASAVCLAIGLFGASLVPFFLLLNADLSPHSWWRRTSRAARMGRLVSRRRAPSWATAKHRRTVPNGATR